MASNEVVQGLRKSPGELVCSMTLPEVVIPLWALPVALEAPLRSLLHSSGESFHAGQSLFRAGILQALSPARVEHASGWGFCGAVD